ncbi:ABC transporter permease [Rhizorhapis sp. SPR117]|uniref:ABC transporter permease n=1 Tax=Rhizorhapis sp. SPR117 TaxID=2912611 RepID=UPI001F38421F|nr:ABC transporter permease [Rhizorhapis sp. SPR117]
MTGQDFGWRGSWRIARRDLHVRLIGLRLLFVCLFLGVAMLAAIGSLTSAITKEISERGQVILGGDIQVEMTQREASDVNKRMFARLGDLSETIRMRAMARRVGGGQPDGLGAVLTELKGVDGAYPLFGTLQLQAGAYTELLADDAILIDKALSERLSIVPGDRLRYGEAEFTVQDIISDEPDRVGEGFTLGPVAIVSMKGLRRTGLIQPGSLFESKYRIRIPAGEDAVALRKRLEKEYASRGWEIDDRENAAPGTSRFLGRMGQFLSLIGLTALAVAGIGVNNGVTSYLSLRRRSIATLKILGATSTDIARIYLLQIGIVSVLAIASGVAVGAIVVPLILAVAGDVLPVRPGFDIHPLPLVTSMLYGLLIALIFAVSPLARVRHESGAALLRATVDPPRHGLDGRSKMVAGIALFLLLALVLAGARDIVFSLWVIGAISAVLLLLSLLGLAARWAARKVPRPRRPLLRLAITNLHRPGAQTTALVIALGLALTLFVTLAGIQTSLSSEIENTVPDQAPDLFVLDVPSDDNAKLHAIVMRADAAAKLNVVPALRGTVIAYGGQRVTDRDDVPGDAFLLRGERGATYSATLPEGSELVKGRWWPADYDGPPLVSLDAKQAEALNLDVGDTLTVSVLGREIEARIASLRQINWDTMGFNYVMVFSPSALANAPHSLTATITLSDDRKGEMTRALLAAFPSASVIDTGDVLGQVRDLLDQMAAAIVAAASITILAGIAVLIGAISASRQTRSYDSIILKTLGATRWQILGTQLLEYGLIAAVLAIVSLLLGMAAAWFVIVQVFEFGWAPDWRIVLATLLGGAVMTLGIGLVGSLPLMTLRPAQALRKV